MKSLSSGTQQNVWRNNDNDITPQLPCPSSSGGSRENRLPPHSCPRKLWPSPITLVPFECMCHYSTGDLFLWLPGTNFIPVLNHLLANGKRRANGIKMRLRFFPGTTLGNVSSNLLTHIWTAQWDVVPIHGRRKEQPFIMFSLHPNFWGISQRAGERRWKCLPWGTLSVLFSPIYIWSGITIPPPPRPPPPSLPHPP